MKRFRLIKGLGQVFIIGMIIILLGSYTNHRGQLNKEASLLSEQE